MAIFTKLRLSLSVMAQIISVICLLIGAYYTFMYFVDTENHLRHEYLMGTWLGLMQAAGFSIGSALLALTVKNEISNISFQILTMPGLILGIFFLLLYLWSFAYDFATRT